MFSKKKCPNCGAKNPERLRACAICGVPFALRQMKEQLEGRKRPTPAWPREVEEEKTEKEEEITCPKCGAVFLASPEEDAIICPNYECRAVPQTKPKEEALVFEGKATIRGYGDAEIADCYVREGHVIIESREPLRIPLAKIKGCDINMPALWGYGSGTRPVAGTVWLRFLDASGKSHTMEFEMSLEQALSLKASLSDLHLMPRWFKRLQVSSPKVSGREMEEKPGFFDRLYETFRDHTRDRICAGLRTLGVDAQMDMSRRAAEENIGTGDSLGVMDIPEGAIRWVNACRFQSGKSTSYNIDYGVPDPRLRPDSPWAVITSVRVKSFPLVGQVVDMRWKGKDFGLGIIDRLNKDTSINKAIRRSFVEIRSYRDYRCWIISTEGGDPPTQELWSCYQAIARHLLADWPPG